MAHKSKLKSQTRQHTVPQMYLRFFAAGAGEEYAGQIWCLRKAVGGIIHSPPAALAQEPAFYTFNLESRTVNDIDDFFTANERRWHTVLAKLQEESLIALTVEELAAVVEILVYQYLRTAAMRENVKKIMAITDKLWGEPKQSLVSAAGLHALAIRDTFMDLARVANELRWTLWHNPQGADLPLLTSDAPVLAFGRKDGQVMPGAKWNVPGTTILLPLSPHRALTLHHGGRVLTTGVQTCTREQVRLWNALQVESSAVALFSNTPEFIGVNELLIEHPDWRGPFFPREENERRAAYEVARLKRKNHSRKATF